MTNNEDALQGQVYQAWEAVVAECNEKLESHDRAEAGEIKGASEFRMALEGLVDDFPNDPSRHVTMLLLPTTKHYEMFANTFVAIMAQSVDVSMLWGLLFLVVKISLLDSPGTIERISGMLRDISSKIQLINKCLEHRLSFHDDDIKRPTLELNRDIVYLWLHVITMFRNQDLDFEAWENIENKYNKTSRSLSEAAKHFERLMRLAEIQSRMINWAMLRDHLPLQTNYLQAPSAPCNNVPLPRNNRFFGREEILKQVGEDLQSTAINQGLSSVALYGLHGLGKSQIALSFAYKKLDEFHTVFWVSGDSELAVQQSLSDIALKTLQLSDAQAGSPQENSILVMHWLKSNSKWLLIYDNVTIPEVFERYWPITRHGSILITTNRRSLTSQPVDKVIEVVEFTHVEGARFLVQSIPDRVVKESDREFHAALILSKRLGGHALGISQMAALIHSRGESIEKFLFMYEKNERRCHERPKNGWKHAAYKHSLATIWALSFGALNANERLCLGVLCFFKPDSIPSAVFEISDRREVPAVLKFCSDDFTRGEVVEHLADLALIRYAVSDTLSIHRLVQVQFLFHIEKPDRQEAFDSAVKLLLQHFPSRGESRLIDKDWPAAEQYIQHALALIQSYHDARMKEEPLRSSSDLCNLICDVTWYLMHNDTANNLGLVLATGFDAYQDWDDLSKDVLIKAYLLSNSALHDLDLGEFHIALTRTQECLKIQLSNLNPDHEQVLNSYNNLGIAYGSLAEYDRGLNFLDKAESILKNTPGRNPAKSVLLNVNIGRNYYCMKRFDEAEVRLEAAMADSLEMDSWYWRVIVHLAFASLYCESGELDKANCHTVLAKGIIDDSAPIKITRLISIYAYKAGRVALAQGRVEDSITHLEKANALSQILNLSPGNRARILFALSVALQEVDKRRDEASRLKLEAARLRRAAQRKFLGKMPNHETFEAFDLLVRILDR